MLDRGFADLPQSKNRQLQTYLQKESFTMSLQSIKFGALAVFTSLCGLATTPAFAQNAASVIQTSDQNATQVGSGNVAVQGNVQTGIVTQTGATPYGVQCFVAPCPGGINGANVVQTNQQGVIQNGIGNSSIQGNSSTATVLQGGTVYPFHPYYPYSTDGA
ncbi:MAG: hypothetical protein C4288_15610, partial [Leptolyngbya sp. ERB_1_1]